MICQIRNWIWFLMPAVFLAGQQLASAGVAKKNAPATKPKGTVEIQFVDDSTMKLTLLDERIELNTPYGKLLIPVSEIQRIEFRWRIPDKVAKRIEAAIADFGQADYKRRKAASDTLLALGEKAYPALVQAAKGKDLEVVRRAEQLLTTLRDTIPEERLQVRSHDVVYTENSKIAGELTNELWKAKTFQFGEQDLKLADLRGLRTPGAAEPKQVNALPDPGTPAFMQDQVGKTVAFRVTGAMAGVGGVWGTDVYTMDSSISLAAVHAGILRPGQTGIVRVTILGPVAGFQGSVRNGVASSGYGAWTGYKVSR